MNINIGACLLVISSVLLLVTPSFAEVSTSDPLWDWKYDAIERLSLAFGERTVSNTRPMSRLEMADIVIRISAKAEEDGSDHLKVIIRRLEEDLKEEIRERKEGTSGGFKIRPLNWVRGKAVHSDQPFLLENDYGYKSDKLSMRGEFSTSGTWGSLGYEIRPEYNYIHGDTETSRFDLHSGYLVLWLKNLEIEVGKDSMWWGPGRHGAWLLTNNSPAFDMIKLSNAVSAVPPWFLSFMGETRMSVFLGQLNEQQISYLNNGSKVRESKKPLLSGVRINFSPSKYLELGVSQTITFANRRGEGYTADNIRKTFLPSWEDNEAEEGSGPLANRITSTDLTINVGQDHDFMRSLGLKGLKVYWEQGGETLGDSFIKDNSKIPQVTNVSNLYGVYADTGKADFRVEYAFNYDATGVWYRHYQFEEGYKNEDFYIGHNHSQDLFIEIKYPCTETQTASVYYEKGQRNWELPWEEKIGLSLEEIVSKVGKINLTYEYRYGDNPQGINQFWIFEVLHRF